jgi:hypothetical protein
MNVRWALSLPMWTFIALLVLAARVEAQGFAPAGPGAYSPETPGGMMQGYGGPSPEMASGGPGMPYGGPGMPDGGMGMPGAGDPYCDPAGMYGGGGDGHPYRGLLGDFFGLVGPYADGGCCAPRYFDVSIEAMWLQRDGERNINLASAGIAGPAALSTNQFRFDERPSFRFIGWIPFRSMGNLEFVYYGLFHHADQVQVNDPGNNLFSALSNFGTRPFGGFLEEGNAAYMREELSSTFDNFEANYRRHWQGADCRLQGSWLMGVRYFKFDEDFDFVSVSTLNSGQLRYHVNATNSLVGAQTGGDAWLCIIPGLRLGTEAKAGIYGNHSSQGTKITATSLAVPFTESALSNDVAFVGDASVFLTYRINYQMNIKVGYNFLFVDGLTLAAENFNRLPPNNFVGGVSRPPVHNDNGNILYSGYSIGVEYNW